VVNYKQMCTYIIVAYANRFSEPDEDDWGRLAGILSAEIGMNTESIKRVFRDCRDRNPNVTFNKLGAGRPKKLERDNPGLIAAAIALNTGQSPAMATEVCNAQNKDLGITVCKDTLLSTLADYTDMERVATLHCKTGKKDEESDWAVARHAQSDQMLEQQHLGALVDTGELKYKECNPDLPPIWDDGTLWVDENHIQQVLPGGTGQDSSFSRQQYRIAIDPKTGKLLPLKQGGKMPRRKFRRVPKYPQEARAAYGCATPTIDGEKRGKMMQPFDYTGKKLVSYKDWKKLVKQEIKRPKSLKSGKWMPSKNADNLYKECFGDEWEEKLHTFKGSKLHGY